MDVFMRCALQREKRCIIVVLSLVSSVAILSIRRLDSAGITGPDKVTDAVRATGISRKID